MHCQKPNATSFETIDSRGEIQCTACGKKFTIGDVFQAIYENEPLVKKPIDSIVGYVASQWRLKTDDKEAHNVTETFLRELQFGNLLSQAANQILVHGDAFLHLGDKSWQLFPPQQVRVKTSLAPWHDSKSLFLKDDEFSVTTQKGTESFAPEEIVHFKRTLLSQDEAYGESAILVTLDSLSNLQAFRSAPLRAKAEFQWWHDKLEEQVRLGLMVPDFVLEKRPLGYDRRVAEFVVMSFVAEVDQLQDLLSEKFDEALERFANRRKLKETPELELRKLTERQVLIDCGFDFSKDIETLKKLCELGAFSKEWLDKQLSEYQS